MEPGGSLLCSQEPSAAPHPEPDQPNPYHPILFVDIVTIVDNYEVKG
jgi:hypothetical protein